MVELLLNCKTVCCGCVTRYLVLWRGHASADDSCLRLDELAHCAEKAVLLPTAAPRAVPATPQRFRLPPCPPPPPRFLSRRLSWRLLGFGWPA